MRVLLRSAIIVGSIALGLACPQGALAQTLDDDGAIVWRLSHDGDWLVGLRGDTPAIATPLRESALRPSYADGGATTRAPRPALVLRLDARAGDHAFDSAGACAMPSWLTPDSAGACLGGSNTEGAGLAASLGWAVAGHEVGVEAGTATVPLLLGGSSLSVAPRLANSTTDWPLLLAAPGADRVAVDRFGLDGKVRLGEDLGLNWSAATMNARRTDATAGADLGFDQQALSFGLSRGHWSGGLTGRITRPRPASGSATDIESLDLELTWLTPWQGELRFGAENLLVRDAERQPAQPQVRPSQVPARTPFVRYRQDF
jgi:hypothetical protein